VGATGSSRSRSGGEGGEHGAASVDGHDRAPALVLLAEDHRVVAALALAEHPQRREQVGVHVIAVGEPTGLQLVEAGPRDAGAVIGGAHGVADRDGRRHEGELADLPQHLVGGMRDGDRSA
jgi:hypothetical protein